MDTKGTQSRLDSFFGVAKKKTSTTKEAAKKTEPKIADGVAAKKPKVEKK